MTAPGWSGHASGTTGRTAAPPRTVLHVLGILNRGGAERRTLEVIRALQGDSVRFVVCTLSGMPGSMAQEYAYAGARVVPLHLRDPLFALRFIGLLRRQSVDIVHSHVHFSSALILALARLAGIQNRIAHFRSDSDGRNRTAGRRLRNALLRMVLRHTATAIVGVAPGTLEANWGPGWRSDPRFTVIPNGVDLTRFAGADRSRLRQELDLPPGEPVVVHLGRADIPTKNRELAIEVVAECGRQNSPVQLVFVGRDGSSPVDGARRSATLRALAERQGVADRVHFLGEREDVADLLSSADLLLLTSTREGLPGVLLEATACGIPAVSSDVPGATYIADSVPTVTIVPLGTSPAGWADAVRQTTEGEEPGRRAGGVSANLAGTPFDLLVSLERYRGLWQLP